MFWDNFLSSLPSENLMFLRDHHFLLLIYESEGSSRKPLNVIRR